MKKRVSLLILLMICSVFTLAYGATRTTNLGLTVPAPREDWGTPLANDLRIIDQAFGKLSSKLSDLPGAYAYSGLFNGPEGAVINLPVAVSSISEYFVAVTPTSRSAEIGDISVEQGASSFTVRCSAANTTDSFKAELSYIGDADAYGGTVYREWIAAPDPSITDQAEPSIPRSLGWIAARIGSAHAEIRMPGNHLYQLKQNLALASNISLRMDAGAIIRTWYSIRSVDYRWVATGTGTDEYRCEAAGGGNPGVIVPMRLFINGAKAVRGQAGALTPGQWDYNSSGGFDTVIVRLSDGADPDTGPTDSVRVHYSLNHSGPVVGPIRQRYDCGLSAEDVLFGYSTEVSPEHWGAAGDDYTDDLVPIEAAIYSLSLHGGSFAPLGKTYRVSRGDGALAVNNLVGNLRIRGVPGKTVFKNSKSNGNEYYAIFTGINLANIEITGVKSKGAVLALFISCNDVRVESCTLDGQYAPNDRADKSIAFYGCSRVRVLNNYFENINFGVYIGHATHGAADDVLISGNTFKNTEVSSDSVYPCGVYIFHGKGVWITSNTFSDILPHTITTEGYGVYEGDGTCESLTIVNNKFYHSHETNQKFTAIYANSSKSFNASMNYFDFHGLVAPPAAIKHCAENVLGSTQVLISENTIKYMIPNSSGIWVAEGPYFPVETLILNNHLVNSGIWVNVNSKQCMKINENYVTGSSSNGIRVVDKCSEFMKPKCQNLEIAGNTIQNAAYCGIQIAGVEQSIITNNTIFDCNMSNSTDEDKSSAIMFISYAYGGSVCGNKIKNTPSGKMKYGINFFDSMLFLKFLYSNNYIEGMLVDSIWQGYSASPVKGLNWTRGDIAWNTHPGEGMPLGWVCVRRFDAVIRVQANPSDSTLEVSTTSGVLAQDQIYILMDNGTYHLTTIDSVPDGDTLVITSGIPMDRYAPINGDVRTFRFRPMANLGS